MKDMEFGQQESAQLNEVGSRPPSVCVFIFLILIKVYVWPQKRIKKKQTNLEIF